MSTTIAVAGKGGTGKTTISSLLAKLLSESGTVLAIDADPSVNLYMALGLEMPDTIGDIREDLLEAAQRETALFFQESETLDYRRATDPWITEP